MKRVLWFGLGVAVAAIVIYKGQQVMRKATPAGVQEQVSKAGAELADRISAFASTFTSAMAEKEAELSGELGLVDARRARID